MRFWWHRVGPMFADWIRERRTQGLKSNRWRWHLDEVFEKIKGEWPLIWRAGPQFIQTAVTSDEEAVEL